MNLSPTRYHIESPFVSRDPEDFDRLSGLSTIASFSVSPRRSFSYVDQYWDTSGFDLHNSSLLLRTRRRALDKKIDFLDYKSSPVYLEVSVFARPFWSQAIGHDDEALAALRVQAPSTVLSAFANDRPDLLGRPLVQSASAVVQRRDVDLMDKAGKGFCTLSFHDYELQVRNSSVYKGKLIEVQPYWEGTLDFLQLSKIFNVVRRSLDEEGFMFSPTSKYHRISIRDLQTA